MGNENPALFRNLKFNLYPSKEPAEKIDEGPDESPQNRHPGYLTEKDQSDEDERAIAF